MKGIFAPILACSALLLFSHPTMAAGSAPSARPPVKVVQPVEIQKTAAPAKTSSAQEDIMELAKKSGCLACHALDRKLVGPSWGDVAARYKGDPKAKAILVERVKKGSKGNWTAVTGGIIMPANSPKVPDADIEKLVDYVLSMSK